MENRSGTFVRIAAPLKSLAQRFMYLGLIMTAFGLMLLGKFDSRVIDEVRLEVTDKFVPILEGLSQPAVFVANQIKNFQDLAEIREQNKRLKSDNARLAQWETVARKLQADNRSLRGLLRVVNDTSAKYVTARVVAGAGGVLSNMLILNAGQRSGVKEGHTVIGASGVVGRISNVSNQSSRVLLLTDINSRVPVWVENHRIRAIISGTNRKLGKLVHIPQGVKIVQGDRIITSGHGGVFPSGLPIGTVVRVKENNILVQFFTNFSQLEYVKVADFGLDTLVQAKSKSVLPKKKLNGKFVVK